MNDLELVRTRVEELLFFKTYVRNISRLEHDTPLTDIFIKDLEELLELIDELK